MKKLFLSLIVFFLAFGSLQLQAQSYFEGFDGGMTLTTYNQDGLTPNAAVSYVTDAWIVRGDFIYDDPIVDSVAFSTSWYTPAGTSNDWMVTPVISVGAGEFLSWRAVAPDAAYPDGYEVYIKVFSTPLTPASPGTNVLTVPAENSIWTPRSIDLAPYSGQLIQVAFRNNNFDQFLLMIDDITVSSTTAGPDVAVVDARWSDFSFLTPAQLTSNNFTVDVQNVGGSNATNVKATMNVYYDQDDFTTPLTTLQTNTLPNLGVGDIATLTGTSGYMPSSTIPDTGTVYIFEYILSANVDEDMNNDTSFSFLWVNDSSIARDYAFFGADIGGLGFGADEIDPLPLDTGEFGQFFTNNVAADLTSTTFWLSYAGFNAGGYDVTARVYTFDPVTGPGTLVAESNPVTVDTMFSLFTATFASPVTLPAGDYFIAIVGAEYVGQTFGINSDDYLWGRSGPSSTWTNFSASFPGAMLIWANFAGGTPPQACSNMTVPTGLVAVPNGAGTGVSLSWPAVTGVDIYQAKGRRVGTTPFGQFVTANTSKNVGGLNSCTEYQWYIRGRCEGTGDPGVITQFSAFNFFTTNGCPRLSDLSKESLTLFPIPTVTEVNVNYVSLVNQNVTIQVLGIDGKKMTEMNTQVTEGINQFSFDVSNYASGSYFVSISNGDSNISKSFVVAE